MASFWGLPGAIGLSHSQIIDSTDITVIDNDFSVTVLDIPPGTNDITLLPGRDNQLKFIYVRTANGIFNLSGNILGYDELSFGIQGDSCLLLFNDGKWVQIESVVGPVSAQLSSTEDHVPLDTNELLVTFNSQEEISGIAQSGGDITIQRTGLYHMIFGGQMGKVAGSVQRALDLWIKLNGIDVPNTAVRNAITNIDSQVVILNIVKYLHQGDVIQCYMSVDSTTGSPGLYHVTPAVGPIIPSIIVTIVKV